MASVLANVLERKAGCLPGAMPNSSSLPRPRWDARACFLLHIYTVVRILTVAKGTLVQRIPRNHTSF